MATDVRPNGAGPQARHAAEASPPFETHAAIQAPVVQAPPARAVISWDYFLLGQVTFALIVALVFGAIAYAAGGQWPPRHAAAASGAATAITAFSQGTAAQQVAVAADPSGALKWDRATYEASAGDVSFVVTNDSAMTHNFALTGPGVSVQSADIGPHSTGTFTIKGLPAGQYEIACNIAGHKLAGMVATLVVK